MKASLLSAIALSIFAIQNIALAESVKDIASEVQSQGWFKTCNNALPRLANIKEPLPDSPDWKIYIKIKAGCLSELRRDAEAIIYLDNKFSGGKLDSEIKEYLATSHIRLGSYDKATKILESSLIGATQSRLPEIYSKLALSYSQQAAQFAPSAKFARVKLLEKAESSVSKAIELGNPAPPHFYTQLGQIQTFKGDFVAAENTLNRALRLNESYEWEKPGLKPIMDAEILMAKSQVRRMLGDEKSATYLAQEAIQTSPTESLKIVMKQIHEASQKPSTALERKSQQAASDKSNVLNQIYIPLDEEI
ncbi:hypothetical protein D9M68_239780 [compost metagenome]